MLVGGRGLDFDLGFDVHYTINVLDVILSQITCKKFFTLILSRSSVRRLAPIKFHILKN